MNTSTNPFRIPACLQADLQRQRQVRFKKFVVASIIASTGGLVILLIVGCMSEQSRSAATTAPVTTGVQPKNTARVSRQPVKTLPLTPAVSSMSKSPVLPPPPQSPPLVAQTSPGVYVVKPGDTLTRIARLHKITVNELKAANALESDRILPGAKLKLPPA
jgi:LysM repeat protein